MLDERLVYLKKIRDVDPNVDSMLDQRLRRLSNIKPALAQRPVFEAVLASFIITLVNSATAKANTPMTTTHL